MTDDDMMNENSGPATISGPIHRYLLHFHAVPYLGLGGNIPE